MKNSKRVYNNNNNNNNVAIISVVTDALVTVNKGLVKRLEYLEITGWVETVQTRALLRLARILRRILGT